MSRLEELDHVIKELRQDLKHAEAERAQFEREHRLFADAPNPAYCYLLALVLCYFALWFALLNFCQGTGSEVQPQCVYVKEPVKWRDVE